MDKIENFLCRNDSRIKQNVVFDLERKFKLSKAEANKIYDDWRKRYMKGETKLFFEPKKEFDLENEAKAYAKTNIKKLTEKEIKEYVNSINEIGLRSTCKKFGLENNYLNTLYYRFFKKGLIKRMNRRGGKYA